jgi:hypothetical protein
MVLCMDAKALDCLFYLSFVMLSMIQTINSENNMSFLSNMVKCVQGRVEWKSTCKGQAIERAAAMLVAPGRCFRLVTFQVLYPANSRK